MTEIDARALSRLRPFNLVAGLAHLVQGTLIIVLSNDFSLPVTALFASGPPGTPVSGDQLEELFSYPLGPAVAAFSLLSAFFHFLVVSPSGWSRYQHELSEGRNRFRWVEYSLSASLMIVLIAGITGITDAVALLGLFGANAAMIFFGWEMETKNRADERVDWSPFVFGSIIGAVPWIGISIYLFGAGDEVPNFVYGIFVTIFVAFNCFALVQLLQYRARGGWTDYLRGERIYIVLSLVAKSLLAWQVFANTLV
ncbi:heliorhodopsin HeR [Actinomarinicola tropica]|uniref:Heliorhodopsin HeR n=1 Tax=Actinomarinicola tropica TaxID=2789776 RepID=A0A5Q2RIU4_9ACTN|nr:heliorhodopsin HeR [Actinomarinicola tropica]QGG94306.1 hypothetical protein GH723_03875 [Actinomarinicola tropica]